MWVVAEFVTIQFSICYNLQVDEDTILYIHEMFQAEFEFM